MSTGRTEAENLAIIATSVKFAKSIAKWVEDIENLRTDIAVEEMNAAVNAVTFSVLITAMAGYEIPTYED